MTNDDEPRRSNNTAPATEEPSNADSVREAFGRAQQASEMAQATQDASEARDSGQAIDATNRVASAGAQATPEAPGAEETARAAQMTQQGGRQAQSLAQATSAASSRGSLFFADAADMVGELLGGGSRISHVRYEFSVTVNQTHWEVARVRWSEAISQPYEVSIELVTTELGTRVDDLLGASGDLLIDRSEVTRSLFGVIERVEVLGVVRDHHLRVRVRMVPAFSLLRQQVDTRFFQGQTVLEVLGEVLSGALAEYEREVDVESRIRGTYPRQDYIVQFRESTLDFCSRLMEEAGIAYVFDFSGDDHETLVLIDNNDDYGDVPLLVDDEVPIIEHRYEEADRESIQSFEWDLPRQPNKVVTRGFNLKIPSTPDEASAELEDVHTPTVREVYLHDERRQIVDDPVDDPDAESFTGEGLPQREPLAQRTLELFTARTKTGRGQSNVTGFAAGRRFTLGHHWLPEVDGQNFLLTKVVHEGAQPIAIDEDTHEESWHRNTFEAIPEAHVFRPECRTPRPNIGGCLTGKVVGPVGEEIHTDRLGRIRVKLQWDRLSPDNETASCWMRVAQSWAGPGWGAMFIPRIGMEVLVSFLDGHPDRPLVTGCVYNGEFAPPYSLPQEKTKTTWKTSSSPGGDGYNELTFEDAAGCEQIIVHAQKDFNETVENDHTTIVHANQTIGVGADQSTTVGANQTNTVKKDQTETVHGNVSVTVEGTRSHTITKQETVTLKDALELTVGKTELHQVTEKLTETFDGGRETTVKQGDTETVSSGDKTVTVSSGALEVEASTKVQLKQKTHKLLLEDKIELSTSTDFLITNGKVSVESDGGKLKLTGAEELSLACGAASITLKSDGTIEVQGAKKTTMGTPGSSMVVEPAGVTVSGAKISSTAIGIHEIKGAMVKIN